MGCHCCSQADARYKALREGKLAQAALACEKLLNTASAELNKVGGKPPWAASAVSNCVNVCYAA